MIALTGFGKLRELSISPVIVSSVNDHPTDTVAMTPDPFCGRFNDDVGTMFQGTKQIAGGAECIVDDQRQIIFLGEVREFLEIGDIQPGIADGLKVKCLCVLVDMLHETLRVVAIGKTNLDAEALKGHLELIVGAPIEICSRDEIISRLK